LLQEGVGPIAATVTRADGALDALFSIDASLEQPAANVDTRATAQVLRLADHQVVETFLAGIGVNYTFARLVDCAAVDAAALDHAAWAERMATSWAPQLFIFAHDPVDPVRLYARMFAPALGVPEDPATGSACGALAAAMATRRDATRGVASIAITQGEAMGRRSEIRARAQCMDNRIRVSVGGSCSHVAEGEIEVPAKWLEQ
jgi:trans-2,3-dihydro-3-hydroxyanthranilate isomerase